MFQVVKPALNYLPHENALRSISFSAAICGKHWDPKFRSLRAKKVLKVNLIDFDEMRKEKTMTVEEIRSKLKEKGIVPRRGWNERPIFISSSASVFEPFVPPEGDGKISIIGKAGVQQKYDELAGKGKTYLALRKIRNLEYDFDVPTLGKKAQEIYIEAHKCLADKNEDRLHELVTEKCFPEMMNNAHLKTLSWKFVQSLELPRVVHIRCEELLSKDNMFAQATVRIHTQQILAIYDRFGRLMYGSEDRVKDVLEYVVFEKHLTNQYGVWRIHAKIIPDWMPPQDSIIKTFRKRSIESELLPSRDHSDPTPAEQQAKEIEKVAAANPTQKDSVIPPPA